jgi:hypothetical protein
MKIRVLVEWLGEEPREKYRIPAVLVYLEKCDTNKIWFTDLIYRGGKKNADICGMFPRNIFKHVINAQEVTP